MHSKPFAAPQGLTPEQLAAGIALAKSLQPIVAECLAICEEIERAARQARTAERTALRRKARA